MEPPAPKKNYWTILPIACERMQGHGFKYLLCGTFQLPLIEGPVPTSDIFSSENPFNEIMTRLASKVKTNVTLSN
jgi:hypothetical protein